MPYAKLPFEHRDPNENYRDIEHFPNYEVSDQGRVASKRSGRVLHGGIARVGDGDGYWTVTLRRDNKNFQRYVHILVAEAFLHRPGPKYEVNHINPPTLNNAIWNLEWVTHSENVHHAYRTGLMPLKAVVIEETSEIFVSAAEVARHLEVTPTTISNHLAGRLPHVRGVHISYVD